MGAGLRFFCALAAAGILAAAAGCDDENPVAAPPGAVHVLTDASTYNSGTEIHSILVNDSDRTVYTLTCTEFATLEVQESGTWKDLGAWYLTCDAPTIPLPLEPGNFQELPAIPGGGSTPLPGGTYRIRVAVYGDDTFPYPLIPEDQRLSEPFTIKSKIQ